MKAWFSTPVHECSRWCKVHYYWNFDHRMYVPLPYAWSYHSNTHGWRRVEVFVGPPAYLPKRPDYQQRLAMGAMCPHTQGDLTCNNCLRHTFRPYEV